MNSTNFKGQIPHSNVAREINFAVNDVIRSAVNRNDDINMLRSVLTSQKISQGQRNSMLNERSRIVITKAGTNEESRIKTEENALKLFV